MINNVPEAPKGDSYPDQNTDVAPEEIVPEPVPAEPNP